MKEMAYTNIHKFLLTKNQQLYEKSLLNKNLVVVHGPAGTGKTLIACKHAIQKLDEGSIKKVIFTRPTVSLSENHGFLPGDLNDKMHPWMIPLYENMIEFTTPGHLNKMLNSNKIEIAPIAFIRGRTMKDSLIIADEMQNSSHKQMLALLTRVGSNAQVIVTGDLKQCDLNEMYEKNGLHDFIQRYEKFKKKNESDSKYIDVIKLTNEDISRSEFVQHIMGLYET